METIKKTKWRKGWTFLLSATEIIGIIQFITQNVNVMEVEIHSVFGNIVFALIVIIPIAYLFLLVKWRLEDFKIENEAKLALMKFAMYDDPMNYVEQTNQLVGFRIINPVEEEQKRLREFERKIEAAKKYIRDRLQDQINETTIVKLVKDFYEYN